ncbi:MAG: PASTA domain-containing protein [Sciscionella sp.]
MGQAPGPRPRVRLSVASLLAGAICVSSCTSHASHTVRIPSVIGMNVQQAQHILTSDGLKARTILNGSQALLRPGQHYKEYVGGQTPGPSAQKARGSVVVLLAVLRP